MNLDEAIDQKRETLAHMGFTVKAQWIDNQPGGKLNGLRIMKAEALFGRALTLQVFDRQTVTISWGFSNDDAVTLTKEDGRLFLDWLRLKKMTPLPDEIWQLIPEATDTARETHAAATNMAKARLVDYLVANHADIFGKYGSLDDRLAPGEDFYTALLDLVQNPERDGRDLRRLIQALDNLAGGLYVMANSQLKTGAPAMRWRAIGSVLAAEEIRDMAQRGRASMGGSPPPAPAYPEAISSSALYAQILKEEAPKQDRTAQPMPAHLYQGHRVDDIVTIVGPAAGTIGTIPRAGEIGRVTAVSDRPETHSTNIAVTFKDGQTIEYDATTVRRLQ